MSTIKVNKIENTSTTDGGVSIDNNGHVTIDGQNFPTAGPLSNRNLIINGAMQVAQRGTSVSMATTAVFCTDRFKAVQGSSFNWQSTLTQENDGPSGFSKSLKVNVDTASTLTGSENAVLYYRLEGQDCQSLGYGTSDARTTTLSFWVKSNKTGTYSVQFANNNPTKYLLVEYSINSADTWEYKTMSFVGDTASTVDNDNDEGLDVRWNLAAGSTDLSAPTNTWVSTAGIRASNDQVNLMDTVNNYWQITGVQLEVGSKNTPFEHRSYADELQRCMRYYQEYTSSTLGLGIAGAGYVETGTQTEFVFHLSTPMRTLASANIIEIGDLEVRIGGSTFDVTGLTSVGFNDNFSLATTRVTNVNSSASVGTVARLRANGVGVGFSFNAEL